MRTQKQSRCWCAVAVGVAVALAAATILCIVLLTVHANASEIGVSPNQISTLDAWRQSEVQCKTPASDKDAYTVVVVGAGVAGLSAAQQLRRRSICDVLVVEAQNRVGGRVKQIRDVAPWPLDGGASLISGEHSIVKQLIEDNSLGIPHRASWITNFVLRNDTNELLPLKEGVPEGERLDRLHSKIPKDPEALSSAASVLDLLRDAGLSANDERTRRFAEATISNEFGSEDLSSLGAAEYAWASANWVDGEDTFLKQGTFKPLVDWLGDNIAIRLKWPAVEVRREHNQVMVIGPHSEVIKAQAVVVAVPLTQLKKRRILFVPQLPAAFESIVDAVNVQTSVKVFLLFKNAFWMRSEHRNRFKSNTRFDGMICPGTNFPTVWVEWTPPCDPNSPHTQCDYRVMTAFVHNRRAEVLSTLGEAGAIEEFLSLLDRAFPRSQSGNSSHLSLARETFIRGGLMDWSKEPYIEAGYSSPSTDVAAGGRQRLSSVDGVLFFAGEHTNVYNVAELQGAMETGKRAAADVAAALD